MRSPPETSRRTPSRSPPPPSRSWVRTATSIPFFLIGAQVTGVDAGWVDPDTANIFHKTSALSPGDARQYELVFSDEFNVEGRSFSDGDDPRWTALDKNDYTNDALHFYKSENVQTQNGVLRVKTELRDNLYRAFDEDKKTFYSDKKTVQSGMVQGWNKFCFTGGVVEFSAKLPGHPQIGGLWPALWLLGNLARATYVGSSDYVWPFSYNVCANNTRVSQEINACSKVGHYGLQPGRGRGAPEIDILEAMGGEPGPLPNTHIQRPYFSSSLQVAPGVKKDRPNLGHLPKHGHWYEGLEYGNETNADLNPFFYGVTLVHDPKSYTYQSDALSSNMHTDVSFFNVMHKYRVEWDPPEKDGTGGYIRWYCDDLLVYGISAKSLSLTGTEIPSEPMYMIMNTAVATSWGFPLPCPDGCDCDCFDCSDDDCTCGLPTDYCNNFPAYFEIDYVRVWQAVNESKHIIGCSTKDRPTDLFIKGHRKRYMTDDDKQPLKPLRVGGSICVNDNACGGRKHGSCIKGHCSCNNGFVGSACRAHEGYDENPFVTPKMPFAVRPIAFQNGMLCTFLFLAISFVAAMSLSVTLNRKEKAGYEGIPPEVDTDRRQSGNGPDGLQQHIIGLGTPVPYQYTPAYSQQPQPPQQQVVTYCMIDGRLIDE